ncbi:hypothetical protein Ae201684P_000731 [Aphanomyces euteiches]|uniref:Secreted protein n=1 Tax=Aphanomyces euteiches TaxID=100861 RepID=A0A6G0X9W0_9STRA|nr:hypothetical protein Ae201684_007017 [Aphanomyces euteiches]KAH9087320.1 hypothetical protein Ae201684P_000731 [Aphanomyces euteiches]KAH9133403.1 hypothetical protein AeRB84_020538 [Aphanomyces euteiches]
MPTPTSLLSGVALVMAVASGAPNAAVLDAPVLPVVMGTVLEAYKPLLSDFAQKNLPATVGNCADSNPPTPCTDIGYLFAQNSSLYNIKARWISGISTMTLGNVNYTSDNATGAINLDVTVGFKSLPLSLRVDACLAGVCSNFFDGTSACCGGPKTVSLAATMQCSESYPFLRNFTFTKMDIQPAIELTFVVNGQSVSLFDVTKPVKSGLNSTVAAIIQKDGMDLLNTQIKSLFGDQIFCTQKDKDASTPKPTPSSASSTPSSTSSSSSGSGGSSSGSTTPSSGSDSAEAPATSVPARAPSSNPSPSSSAILSSLAGSVLVLATVAASFLS